MLENFLCIQTLSKGQLNPLFQTFAEFRPLVNRVVARRSTDCLAANSQFSSNDSSGNTKKAENVKDLQFPQDV